MVSNSYNGSLSIATMDRATAPRGEKALWICITLVQKQAASGRAHL